MKLSFTLVTVVLLILSAIDAKPKGFSKSSKGNSYSYTKTKTKTTTYVSSRRSPVSLGSRSMFAYGAGGAATGFLAGIMVSNAMRSSPHYHGMLSGRFTFNTCPGVPMFREDMSTTYNYFVCPSDPSANSIYDKYCCYNDQGLGFCCSRGTNHTAIGGAVSSIIFFILLGTCIYCCFCKNRNNSDTVTETVTVYETVEHKGPNEEANDIQPFLIDDSNKPTRFGEQAPYPGAPGASSYPQSAPGSNPYPAGVNQHGYPKGPGPLGFDYPPTPAPQAAPYPPANPYPSNPPAGAPGSGWGAESPPPPYVPK